ncbi:MAG: flippase [Methanosarcina sp.]|nr:flippase [Methanosarcina sp.]
MNNIKRIAKNTFYLTLAETITKFILFILTIYIARYLKDVGFGKFSFAFAFSSFFAIVSDFGLNTLATREIAKNKSMVAKYLGNISYLKLLISITSFILLIIIINLLKYPSDTKLVVYIVGLHVIITSFNQFYIAVFRAFEKMEYETFVRILEKIFLFFLVIYLIYYDYGLVSIVSAYLISSVFAVMLSYIMTSKIVNRQNTKIVFSFIWDTTKSALPFCLTAIFVTIYFQIDTIMLSIMQNDSAVGYYNAAYRIIFGLMLIPTAFVSSIFPLMSKYCEQSEKKGYCEVYTKGFKYLLLISLPITILGITFADKLIIFIYGPEYTQSINSFKVLLLVIPIIFLTSLFGPALQAANRQHIVTYVTASNATLNIILNYILIPHYSYIGAAVATVITEGLGFTLMYYFISRDSIKLSLFENIVKPLVASFVIILVIYYFKQIEWILASIIGLTFYVLAIYFMKIITRDELRILRFVLGSKTP